MNLMRESLASFDLPPGTGIHFFARVMRPNPQQFNSLLVTKADGLDLL
jgi:hypothetical protein